MANRIILGAFDGTYVLRVSRPGFDVLNPSLPPEQLAFDSRWQETGNVYMEGTFSIGNSGAYTVEFGTTFPTPPVVIVRVIGSSGGVLTYTNQEMGETLLQVRTYQFSFIKGGSLSGFQFSGTRTCLYTVYRNLYD